jgi:glutamate--cysteine ligase
LPVTDRLTRDALVQRFHEYGCPPERWRIGAEFERLLLRGDGSPVGYFDDHGIRWVLQQLVERFGWEPEREGGNIVALWREGASTTLEPGGQFELSGAPWSSLLDVQREAERDFGELRSVAQGHDLHMVALGLTPFARIADIPWVPKGRYAVMRAYLPERGDLATTMMKGTSSFQANFDYADEADCARKVGLFGRLAPLTTATFANSPILEGQDTGMVSKRGQVWTRTDPDRTGVPETLLDGWTFGRWVDYLLEVPMMFYKVGEGYEHARGRTFRTWMDQGIDGRFPTWDDWELHQTSVFPEVRVKRTLEVRGADACPLHIALAGIALWTGLIYDSVALDEAEALSREFVREGHRDARFEAACRLGLGATISGRRCSAWARDLFDIAARGLARSRPDERGLLEPLEALVTHGESPGVAVSRIFAEEPSADRFLRRVLY